MNNDEVISQNFLLGKGFSIENNKLKPIPTLIEEF